MTFSYVRVQGQSRPSLLILKTVKLFRAKKVGKIGTWDLPSFFAGNEISVTETGNHKQKNGNVMGFGQKVGREIIALAKLPLLHY